MKIEGKVHLNMNTYNYITIDDNIIRVKSDEVVKSNNNIFTDNLSKLSDGDIVYKVLIKFLNDNVITSISSKQNYRGKDYYIIKDNQNHKLKFYNCSGFYMNIIIDSYYSNLDNNVKNNDYDNYVINTSNNESRFNIDSNTCYINILRNKTGNIKIEDDLYIKKLLHNVVTEDIYETFEEDKCLLIIGNKKVIMDYETYRKYMCYIELIKRQKENDKVLKLKKGRN